jgi:hypothetical protein
MLHNFRTAILAVLLLAALSITGPAQAQHTLYTDRPTFDTDNPGLLTEDFENGNVPAGTGIGCTSPLDSAGDGVCFQSGELLPGVAYTTETSANGIALGNTWSGHTSKYIVANVFVDSFTMDFDQPTNTAVGADLVCIFGSDTIDIDVYGAGGLIVSTTSSCTQAGTFFGIAASEPITQIVLFSPGNQAEGVDDLSFGSGGEVQQATSARFSVTKDFSDDNSQDVEVSIICNTGLPLEQSFTISDSQADPSGSTLPPTPGVTFVVKSFTDGAMDCTVSETPLDGYSVVYTAGGDSASTNDTTGCNFSSVNLGDLNTCEITNSLSSKEVHVIKKWMLKGDAGDTIDPAYRLVLFCDGEILNGTPQGQSGIWYMELYDGDFLGTADQDFQPDVYPNWDGGTECWVTETDYSSSVEPSNGCGTEAAPGLLVEIDGPEPSCIITNTVFFEGIPTLDKYGLAIMALLMLGVGFVGFRRFM